MERSKTHSPVVSTFQTKRSHFSYSASTLLLGATLALGALLGSSNQTLGAGALPPNSHAFGNSTGEWLKSLIAGSWTIHGQTRGPSPWETRVDTTTGSGTLADPLIFSTTGTKFRKPGDPILDSPIASIVDAADPAQPDSYWGFGNYVTAEVILDGEMIMSEEDCLDYYVPPQIYSPALPNGATAVQGFFYMLHPLKPGVHTLFTRGIVRLPANNLVTGASEFGLEFVWTTTIIVAP
jgi:hypothetical protein